MTFLFDAPSLGHLIALSVRAVLAGHGIEMTEDDENIAGEAAGNFLTSMQTHKEEQAKMVESVSRDLDALPVAEPVRSPSWRQLGMEPPV